MSDPNPKPKILEQFEELERLLRLHVDQLQAHAEAMARNYAHVASHDPVVKTFGDNSARMTQEMLAAAAFSSWVDKVA